MFNTLPTELKQNGFFCLWKKETIGERTTKIPYRIDGRRLSSKEQSDFSSFGSVIGTLERNRRYNGIGLGIFNGYSAIDIDNCCDENGVLSEMAQNIVDIMNSYTEYSPSGKGIRIIFKVSDFHYDRTRYYINNHRIGLEVYVSGCTNKYVTLTGNRISGNTIEERSYELENILNRYMMKPLTQNINYLTRNFVTCNMSDNEIIDKAGNAKNGAKFNSLWNGQIPDGKSHSQADMALLSMLAFWCGGDTEQMDRLFRRSGLYREKWERENYRRNSLNEARGIPRTFYNPEYRSSGFVF